MNKTPEQLARDNIDQQLALAGWVVVDKNKINWAAGLGLAVREYQTEVGPADYVLFVDQKPVGVIEAKREEEGQKLTSMKPRPSFTPKASSNGSTTKTRCPLSTKARAS